MVTILSLCRAVKESLGKLKLFCENIIIPFLYIETQLKLLLDSFIN